MLLEGFGFSNYRSFDDELVTIYPLKKVNLIIGQNNVGKSNILRFLQDQYTFLTEVCTSNNASRNEKNVPFNPTLDSHLGSTNIFPRISFPVSEEKLSAFLSSRLKKTGERDKTLKTAEKLFRDSTIYKDGAAWFTYKGNNFQTRFELDWNLERVKSAISDAEWALLWRNFTQFISGGSPEQWVQQTLETFRYLPPTPPKIESIPAIRKIGKESSPLNDFSGEGIIQRLALIQNPPLEEQESKLKFEKINRFVQDVLENNTARIEIPYNRDMILIHMDGKTLPIDSLGTGVHEVVILAAASTVLDKTIICVEEPELHLHPLLQKILVKYLAEKTDNQYFFTTHSAHLLDAVDSEILHVTMKSGSSRIETISGDKQKSNVCNDLGYKASDILQSNCVIWVEGPSDRIYLNYWIKAVEPNLVEGIHYSIMFYGGKSFSHLTALESEEAEDIIEDLISVRKLNRNSAIMFDSDARNSKSSLSQTKLRLKEEFDQGPGFAWVTAGREVENYLDPDEVEKSVIRVHPSTAAAIQKKTVWSNLLKYQRKDEKGTGNGNKVKVARDYVAKNSADFDKLDLKERIKQLVEFIYKSN